MFFERFFMVQDRFFSDSVVYRFEKCCIIGIVEEKEMMCLGKLLDNLESDDRYVEDVWENLEFNCFLEGGNGE